MYLHSLLRLSKLVGNAVQRMACYRIEATSRTMHLDKFDLNLLVALDMLLAEKHVTRAAEKLCISQPAMSAALARLRAYFDDELLTKVGMVLELTPRAQELAGEVRDLIFRIRSTLKTEPSFDPATGEREMRLIMSDYAATVIAPILVRALLADAPQVRVLIEHLTPNSLTQIDRGFADFCLTVEQRELLEDSIITQSLSGAPLFEDEFVVVMDAESPGAKQPMTIDRFTTLPYVEVRLAHDVFSVVDMAIRRSGLTMHPIAVMPSFLEAVELVPGTQLVAVIPRRLANLLCPARGLVVLPSPISLPRLRETLIWHRRNDADPAHVWFRSCLHQAARALDFDRDVSMDHCFAVSAIPTSLVAQEHYRPQLSRRRPETDHLEGRKDRNAPC